LATQIVQVKPYDRESKGVVERTNQFLETSFLPGRVFTSPEDFNNQLAQWLPKANARLVRRTGARPRDLLAADKAAMLSLPPVPPVTGFTTRVRLPRDYYIPMGSNDYSVHPQAIAGSSTSPQTSEPSRSAWTADPSGPTPGPGAPV
jgi:hypothetical protein